MGYPSSVFRAASTIVILVAGLSAAKPEAALRTGGPNELFVRVECGAYKLGRECGAPQASLVKSELCSGWALGAHHLNTVGIWQAPRLVASGWPSLERPFVRTVALGDESATIRTTIEVKRAYGSPWPCLVPPHLNYDPGCKRTTAVYSSTRENP